MGGLSVMAYGLRGLAFASFFVSAIVVLCSRQKIYIDSYRFTAYFNHWNGLIYFEVVCWIALAYNLAVMAIPAGSGLWKVVVVLDVVVSILVGTSLGAGWETWMLMSRGKTIVARYGVEWVPLCGSLPYFCSKIFGSLVTCSCGFFLSVLLMILSLHISVNTFLVD